MNRDHLAGARFWVRGVVQGVGFRPFVYGLAQALDLRGWVRNTSAGVEIQVEGLPARLEVFSQRLRAEAPPLACIQALTQTAAALEGCGDFRILPSQALAQGAAAIPADTALCPACRRELFDPHDRRYRYPFINCTHCGPRYTIIDELPYDRARTTMRAFPLCAACAAEYADPGDRRFHAQPTACPDCGPQIWLEARGSTARLAEGDAALAAVQRRLTAGEIVAIKGLGGFHLACLPEAQAVAGLRQRKQRDAKPLALMAADFAAAAAVAEISPEEAALLTATARPIVLLRARPGVSAAVAPGQGWIGVMLPYTPLHELLFAPVPGETVTPPRLLVMTSANRREEPLVIDNQAARLHLADLADAFLMHNRPIAHRADDSVVQGGPRPAQVRRARGYAPTAIDLPAPVPAILASGAELKSAFCLTRGAQAFLSPHIGDLENLASLAAYEAALAHYERLLQIEPAALAHDLHPDYLATQMLQARAARTGLPLVGVQHHRAHIAAVLAEAGVPAGEAVLGVACDGSGWGDDGTVWGGEFFVGPVADLRRAAHLRPLPLPGGDAAVRHPARLALAYLAALGLPWQPELPPMQALTPGERAQLQRLLASGLPMPQTSSLGRLFDAAAALIGVRQQVNYEAQAAMELEALALAAPDEDAYPCTLDAGRTPWQLDPTPLLAALIADRLAGVPAAVLAGRFQRGVAAAIVTTCLALRAASGVNLAALGGGVWQNRSLRAQVAAQLQAAGFTVLLPQRAPVNDGGLALGQAWLAAQSL